ncbi:MAG: protein translocase subunit SecD [Actinobacteria bacterium]|nr:protein translocase subunit SecD [Actinomycetota bacterium]
MSRRLATSLAIFLSVVALALGATFAAGNEPSLGLDLQGGVSVTQEPVGDYNSESLDVAVERIRERVDSLGVAEPEIIRQGDAIVVNLPGVENQDEAIRLVQVTGEVLLRPVLAATPITSNENPPASVPAADPGASSTIAPTDSGASTTIAAPPISLTLAPPATATPGPSRRPMGTPTTTIPGTTLAPAPSDSSTSVPAETTTTVAADASASSTSVVATEPTVDPNLAGGDPSDPTATVIARNADGSEIYQLGPAFASGEVFNSDAQADIIQGGWGVRVTLKGGAAGADLWNVGASQCFSGGATCPTRRMAIVLDGVVQSAPTVNQPSFSGGVDITGSFSESEAKDLARVLKSGALPVRLEVQAVQTVSPTLGDDSLQAAIIAGLIGVALVLLFMIFYYRTLALVVVGGLLVSGAIQWSVISLLSKTNGLALSLSGAAGIIVSIGVTVDSYVVFFEKLKDEVRAGRTMRNSAERSFKSAWRTIIAADIVSLIGAFTLWYLTVGSVRGFAFFLGLSTLCDVVVAWFFTRPTMLLIARGRRFGGGRALGVDSSSSGVANPVGGAA